MSQWSSPTTRALLVTPPLLKYSSGPSLGVAMLAGAARAHGHAVDIRDLNAAYLHAQNVGERSRSEWVGDHDRSDDALRVVARKFESALASILPPAPATGLHESPYLTAMFDHEAIDRGAQMLAASDVGTWIRTELESVDSPSVIGVSVLYSGQVIWGLAVSLVARDLFPDAKIIWGGPHVTALAPEIAGDRRYGRVVDGFVAGYAERTWVDILDAVARGDRLPRECFVAGAGRFERAIDDGSVVPCFDRYREEGVWRVLPAQLSRGCAYAKCAFCTYPNVEASFRELDSRGAESVIAAAIERRLDVSFKDSLLTAPLLRRAGALVQGRTRWSGCTKLTPGLAKLLPELAGGGCATLEIGLETLDESTQRMIDKAQSRAHLDGVLDAAERAGIAMVINCMTGFPGERESGEWLRELRGAIAARKGLRAKIEHNRFQLERRAPLSAGAERGIQVTNSWPWSSVLEWKFEPVGSVRRLEVVS